MVATGGYIKHLGNLTNMYIIITYIRTVYTYILYKPMQIKIPRFSLGRLTSLATAESTVALQLDGRLVREHHVIEATVGLVCVLKSKV